jgi:hypothetical protein
MGSTTIQPTRRRGWLTALAAACLAAAPLAPGADDPALAAVIQRARAAVGPEAALDAVKSIRFTGTITLADGRKGDIEIVVRRPMHQRVAIIVGGQREVTALCGYDGWQRLENLRDSDDWQLTLLDAGQVMRSRANTLENFAFFRHRESDRVDTALAGTAEVDGIACDKVVFAHMGGVRFTRFFDHATGRLVLTETENGGTLREKGEAIVRGVRFPREIEAAGHNGTSSVFFASIEVNEEFPDSMFEVPALPRPKPKRAAPASPPAGSGAP